MDKYNLREYQRALLEWGIVDSTQCYRADCTNTAEHIIHTTVTLGTGPFNCTLRLCNTHYKELWNIAGAEKE
jgi:hypothetical protein